MTWHHLTDADQLDRIVAASHTRPQLIFKHSTRCSISATAYDRLERSLPDLAPRMDVWYLDLLAYRPISNAVAERLHVHHESPQTILLHNGEVVLDQSHFGIQPKELAEVISSR